MEEGNAPSDVVRSTTSPTRAGVRVEHLRVCSARVERGRRRADDRGRECGDGHEGRERELHFGENREVVRGREARTRRRLGGEDVTDERVWGGASSGLYVETRRGEEPYGTEGAHHRPATPEHHERQQWFARRAVGASDTSKGADSSSSLSLGVAQRLGSSERMTSRRTHKDWSMMHIIPLKVSPTPNKWVVQAGPAVGVNGRVRLPSSDAP